MGEGLEMVKIKKNQFRILVIKSFPGGVIKNPWSDPLIVISSFVSNFYLISLWLEFYANGILLYGPGSGKSNNTVEKNINSLKHLFFLQIFEQHNIMS